MTTKDTAQEHKFGLMVLSMKENGASIKQMVVVNFGMLMEMSMKANGKMIRLMDMEFTCMSMEQNMKATGRMISRMVTA
jgi:hypothetical protein